MNEEVKKEFKNDPCKYLNLVTFQWTAKKRTQKSQSATPSFIKKERLKLSTFL